MNVRPSQVSVTMVNASTEKAATAVDVGLDIDCLHLEMLVWVST